MIILLLALDRGFLSACGFATYPSVCESRLWQLMLDGSISARGTEVNSPHAPSLHKVKTPEEEHKGVINNMVRRVKDAA